MAFAKGDLRKRRSRQKEKINRTQTFEGCQMSKQGSKRLGVKLGLEVEEFFVGEGFGPHSAVPKGYCWSCAQE